MHYLQVNERKKIKHKNLGRKIESYAEDPTLSKRSVEELNEFLYNEIMLHGDEWRMQNFLFFIFLSFLMFECVFLMFGLIGLIKNFTTCLFRLECKEIEYIKIT